MIAFHFDIISGDGFYYFPRFGIYIVCPTQIAWIVERDSRTPESIFPECKLSLSKVKLNQLKIIYYFVAASKVRIFIF